MKLSHSYSSIKQYEQCPLRFYRQRVLKDVTDPGGEAAKYGEQIHKLLEDRLNGADLPKDYKKYEPLCQSFIKLAEGGDLHVEKELVLTEELTPTGWWDKDAWLRSKLDILVIKGDVAVVADWKTGARRPDFFQMEMFAAQVFKHFPEVNTCKTTLVWLKDMKLDRETYARADTNVLWGKILSKIRRVYDSLEHDNWPARPSGLCRYCPAYHDCDYAS